MMIFNVASLSLLLLSWLLPRAPDSENFGAGSIGSKLITLGVAIFFTVFIAGFRTGTAWSAARLASNAAWYDSKAAFYVILFGFEIIIVYLFLFTQFHRRFWVPNGSNKPGDYSQIDLDGSTAKETSEHSQIDLVGLTAKETSKHSQIDLDGSTAKETSEQHNAWEQDSASVQDKV